MIRFVNEFNEFTFAIQSDRLTARHRRDRIKEINCANNSMPVLQDCDLVGGKRGNLRKLCEHLKLLCPQLKDVDLMDVDFDDARACLS